MPPLFEPLNMDYSKTVIVSADDHHWLKSPAEGVLRIPLEREQSESGWATSLVRYTSGAEFPPHSHPGGEQIYVLDGIFSDETGDYPTDTYVQNPVGSIHKPFSKEGALIFVRLGSVELNYRQSIKIPHISKNHTLKIQTGSKDFLIIRHAHPKETLIKSNREIFLIQGRLIHHTRLYSPLSWFRIAAKDQLVFQAQDHVTYLERPLLRYAN